MAARLLAALGIAAAVGAFFATAPRQSVSANPSGYLVDSDGDLLPDAVEWALMTDAQSRDTDGDSISDYVEVVQFGEPLTPSVGLPPDHEMRSVVTTEIDAHGVEHVWLHLLFRFMGAGMGELQRLDPWLVYQGTRYPFSINSGLSNSTIKWQSAGNEGTLVTVSLRIVDRQVFSKLLPCTMGADALIGTKSVSAGNFLFEDNQRIAHLLPFENPHEFAIQYIGPRDDPNPFFKTNKICVMELEEVGSTGPVVVYEIENPRCEDASGLECATNCTQSAGQTIFLPDGISTITGG